MAIKKPTKVQMEALKSAVHNNRGPWIPAGRFNLRTEHALRLNGWFTLGAGNCFLHLTEEGLDAYNRYAR